MLMDVTPEEARHITNRRASVLKDDYFQQGLEAAAKEIMKWDGAIEDENNRRLVAAAVRRLKRPRKSKQQKEG